MLITHWCERCPEGANAQLAQISRPQATEAAATAPLLCCSGAGTAWTARALTDTPTDKEGSCPGGLLSPRWTGTVEKSLVLKNRVWVSRGNVYTDPTVTSPAWHQVTRNRAVF